MQQAERALLSAALVDNTAIAQAGVLPEHFSDSVGERIWHSVLVIHGRGDPVDPVTLQGDLSDDLEAMRVIGQALQEVGSSANAKAYARAVRTEHKRRELLSIADGLKEDAADRHPNAAAGDAISELVGLSAGDRSAESDAKSLMAKTMEMIDRASQGDQLGLRTGYSQLDRKLGGWHRGDLVIVGARPSMGKSAFGLGAAVSAARHGARVGVVSTEMDGLSLGVRLAAGEAGIPIHDARCGRLADADWARLAKAGSEIAALPLRFLEAAGWRMGEIIQQAHAWHAIGLDMLVIDYLQRINADGKHDRHDLAVGSIAKQAKTLATTLGIPVVMLAQLSRDLEKRDDKRPRMSDLRDSGELEQEADSVLMLYRDAVYHEASDDREAEILVEKNRQGPVGMIRMTWLGETAQWVDPDKRDWQAVA